VAREYLGYDGLFATRGDPISLAEQLSRCLFPPADAPDIYVRMGLRLRQRAVQSFGWEKAGQQILDNYRELTGDIVAPATSVQPWTAKPASRR